MNTIVRFRTIAACVVIAFTLARCETTKYGPFVVVGRDVNTQVDISPGNTIRVTSTGLVDFGGAVIGLGAPKLDADGDAETTPSNYPAPTLRKNSLICRIGLSENWYQGGTDRTFTPSESGKLILRANDFDTRDNSRGWEVTVYVTRPR